MRKFQASSVRTLMNEGMIGTLRLQCHIPKRDTVIVHSLKLSKAARLTLHSLLYMPRTILHSSGNTGEVPRLISVVVFHICSSAAKLDGFGGKQTARRSPSIRPQEIVLSCRFLASHFSGASFAKRLVSNDHPSIKIGGDVIAHGILNFIENSILIGGNR